MLVKPLSNTTKDYKCVTCGSNEVSVIREDAANPRLKCNSCNFMFNGQDSLAAQEANAIAIPGSSPESLAAADEPETVLHPSRGSTSPHKIQPVRTEDGHRLFIPRTPKYVFVSKTRSVEFCTDKTLKETALRWESQGVKYDIYELTAKKSVVKVDIS